MDYLSFAYSFAKSLAHYEDVTTHIRTKCVHDECEILLCGLCVHCHHYMTKKGNDIIVYDYDDQENFHLTADSFESSQHLAFELCQLCNIPNSIVHNMQSYKTRADIEVSCQELNFALLNQGTVSSLVNVTCNKPHLDNHSCPPCRRPHVDDSPEPKLTPSSPITIKGPSAFVCRRPHLDNHTCPASQKIYYPCNRCDGSRPDADHEQPDMYLPYMSTPKCSTVDPDKVFNFMANLADIINVPSNADFYNFLTNYETKIKLAISNKCHTFGIKCDCAHDDDDNESESQESEEETEKFQAPKDRPQLTSQQVKLTTSSIFENYRPDTTSTSPGFDFSKLEMSKLPDIGRTTLDAKSSHPSAPTFTKKPPKPTQAVSGFLPPTTVSTSTSTTSIVASAQQQHSASSSLSRHGTTRPASLKIDTSSTKKNDDQRSAHSRTSSKNE